MLFSHSRLSTFEQCAKKFKFRYVDKVETVVEQSIEAFLGTLVHKALEKLYKDLRFQKTNTLEEILKHFNSEWKKNWNKEIIIVRKDYTGENYRKMGEKFLADYFNRYQPFNHTRTIDLEKRVIIDLDGSGKYKLQGYIDRLACAKDGVYEVHDYKTNANLTAQQYLEEDRQLALYALAVKEMYKDAMDVKLIWHFLAFDKEIVITKTGAQFEQLKKDTIELIKGVRAETEYRSKVSALCEWCEFRPICPEWSHLYKTEKLSPEKFTKDSGVKLVNKFAELYNQKKHIEEQMEKLKESIVRFSKEKGVNTVFGSDHKTKIYTYENLKFPDFKDPRRDVLETIVKQFGLWKEASRLDLIRLSNLIKDGQIAPEIVKELKKFYTKEETNIVKLSKFEKKEY